MPEIMHRSNISTHALREEGDLDKLKGADLNPISTHALREEGDCLRKMRQEEADRFLPTPSARRATADISSRYSCLSFLPTPSARRATRDPRSDIRRSSIFLPTPSARRATSLSRARARSHHISTHALREEGDPAPGHLVTV